MLVRSMVVALLITAVISQSVSGQGGTIPNVESVAPAVSASDNPMAEPQPSDTADSESAAAAPAADVIASSQKPEIPYYAIAQMLQSLRQMELNPAQKAAVDGFYSVGRDRLNVIREIRMAVVISSHRRFDRALANAERSVEASAAKVLLATLTADQKSQLRRKHRGAISEAVQRVQMSEESHARMLVSMSASTPMMNNDLLTAVQIPSVQDILQLTDEQFLAIEGVAPEADKDADRIVQDCIDELLKHRLPFVPASAPVSPAMQKLKVDMDGILTKDQQHHYEEHLKNRQDAAHALFATDPQNAHQLLAGIRSHGVPSESYTLYDHGSVTVTLKLTNYFASDEVAQALSITTDQQTRIADSLRQAETELTREMEAAGTKEQKQQAEKHKFVQHRLDENLETTNQKIRAILTDAQLTYLQKEKFRGLGIASLKESSVQSALELTDEQKQQIETVLTRKPEGINKDVFRPVMFSPADDFEKRSADMRKHYDEVVRMQEENSHKYQEHIRTQHADLWKILSPEQIRTLQKMTGLSAPAAKRI